MRTYHCRTEDQLRDAGSSVAGGSGRLVFDELTEIWHGIDGTRQITIGDADNPADAVRLVFRPGGMIYSHADSECLNMIQFYARSVEIMRPHVCGYQGEGSVFKSNYDEGCERFSVSGGEIADCGSLPKKDTRHWSQVFGLHHHHRCEATFEGVRLRRCANGNDQHSHCFYVDAGRAEYEDCEMIACGQVFAPQKNALPGAIASIEGCRVYGVDGSCYDVSEQKWVPPSSVIAFNADRKYHISENEFLGRFRRVYHLWPDLAHIHCNANLIHARTDGAILARSLSNDGTNYTVDDWRSILGHDTISEISVTSA